MSYQEPPFFFPPPPGGEQPPQPDWCLRTDRAALDPDWRSPSGLVSVARAGASNQPNVP